MGLFDNKNRNGDISMSLEITAGKENLKLSFLSNRVKMAQRDDGLVYFDSLPDRYFQLMDYTWDGPVYKTVSTSKETGKTKKRDKEKTRRKGGLGGAVIGSMIMPGVGTAIGYAMTSKKVKKGKGKATTKMNTIVDENQVETDSIAKIQLSDVETGESFSIGIKCNSKVDVDLDRFDWSSVPDTEEEEAETRRSEADKIKLLKEYKDLLDMGVISQEEFQQKKADLLG